MCTHIRGAFGDVHPYQGCLMMCTSPPGGPRTRRRWRPWGGSRGSAWCWRAAGRATRRAAARTCSAGYAAAAVRNFARHDRPRCPTTPSSTQPERKQMIKLKLEKQVELNGRHVFGRSSSCRSLRLSTLTARNYQPVHNPIGSADLACPHESPICIEVCETMCWQV